MPFQGLLEDTGKPKVGDLDKTAIHGAGPGRQALALEGNPQIGWLKTIIFPMKIDEICR